MNKCYTTAFDICDYYWIDLVLVHSCSRRVSSILSFSAEGYSNVSTIIFLLKPKRLVLRVMKDDKQLTVWKLLHHWICTVFLSTACELILVFQVGNPMSSKMLPLIRSDLWLDLWWGKFFFFFKWTVYAGSSFWQDICHLIWHSMFVACIPACHVCLFSVKRHEPTHRTRIWR